MTGTAGRLHFGGFDAVRGAAALGVVAYHLEEFLALGGRQTTWGTAWLANLGPSMVSLFFVLSGFLITALLLAERRATGAIDVGAFYVRRILRIWPLYFVVVLFALGVLPRLAPTPPGYADPAHVAPQVIAFLLVLLPNLAFPLFPEIAGAGPTWSIGVEEQFYAVWPWIVRRFGERLVPIGLGLILGRALLQTAFVALSRHPQATAMDASRAHVCAQVALFLGTIQVAHFVAGAWAARVALRTIASDGVAHPAR